MLESDGLEMSRILSVIRLDRRQFLPRFIMSTHTNNNKSLALLL